MIYEFRYRVEVDSAQKATALRDQLGGVIEADEDVKLIAADATQETRHYLVEGVDTETRQPIDQVVEAQNPDEAAEAVATETIVVVRTSEAIGQ